MVGVEGRVFAEFCAAGLWPGVGAAVADALAEAGIDRAARVSEQALAALPSVTDKRARRLYSAWIGAGALFDLATLLVPQQLPVRWARRLSDVLGDGAAGLLTADPWRLLDLPEADLSEADRLARAVDPAARAADPRRLSALVVRVLSAQARSGHTVTPVDLAADRLSECGLSSTGQVAGALDAALASGRVRRVTPAAAPTWAADHTVALERLAAAEEAVAAHLARLVGGARQLVSDAGAASGSAGLDPVQTEAVLTAVHHGVSLLTGGPGTGKSRTVAALVHLCRHAGVTVAVAAPTGRAAKRLTELLAEPAPGADQSRASGGAGPSERGGEPDAAGEACTIHRLLGARPPAAGGGFEYDESNPLDVEMVVIDETSMLDVELAAALVAAIPTGAHLLLVGDPAQLPSIGPGRVLGDLLEAARYPATELATLYRQEAGGAIARLATAVRGGELIAPAAADHEVVIVGARDSIEAARRVVQLVTDSIPRVFHLAADQIQVVTPVHRGPAGTAALNSALKAALNPGPHRGTVRGFDVGDRVVATANHFDAEPTGYANGEIGTVLAAERRSILVGFPGGDAEVLGKALGELQHGWAITVHRAQGSEWEAVVAVFPREAGRMLSRPLVYTALTRARRHLSAVPAAGPMLAHAVRRIGSLPRRTALPTLLAEASGSDAASGNDAGSGNDAAAGNDEGSGNDARRGGD